MITSLVDYIGLVNVQDNPTSGRFVNDLPGITSRRVEETWNQSDNYDISEAWQRIERTAINMFEQKLMQYAKKYYKNYSEVGLSITGQYDSNVFVPTSTEYKGVFFQLPYSYYQSLSYNINRVNLQSGNTVNTTIYAFNAATGETIYTKEVSLVEGNNFIPLDWHFPTWKFPDVFIAYDAEEVETIEQNTYATNYPIGYTSWRKVNKSLPITKNNIIASGSQNGLIVTFSVTCSLDNFVSNRLILFQEAYLYCLGAQVLRESVRSEEINRYTLLDYEQAEAAITEFNDECDNMIEANMKGLIIEDQPCFICNRLINQRILIP